MQIRMAFKRAIKVRDLLCTLSCVFALFPCFFSNIFSSFGIITKLFIYFISFLLGYGATSRIRLEQWKLKTLLAWGILFLVCICNRNGDLQHSNYAYMINLFFIIVFCVAFVFQNKAFLTRFLIVMVALLTVHLVFGLYFLVRPSALISLGNRLFSLDAVSYNKFLRFVNAGAFMGITSHYSTSGMYMAVAVVLMTAFVLAYRDRHKKWHVPSLILLGGFFVALILTQKRAQLLFAAFALVLVYLVGYVRGNLNRRLQQLLLGAAILLVVFFLLMNIPAFQATVSRYMAGGNLDDVSSGRISQLWTPAWNEFLEHPVFGIGWRQFKYAHPMSNGANNDVHNIYLQFLTENGIVGAAYIMILITGSYFSTWKMLIRCKNSDSSDNYMPLLFSFGYQTFFLLYGITGNPFYEESRLLPYFLSCCICYKCCAEYGYRRERVKIRISAWRAS